MTDIYKLELHKIARFDSGQIQIVRVPGGWIYIFQGVGTGEFSTCFVSFNNEFQDETNTETDRTD